MFISERLRHALISLGVILGFWLVRLRPRSGIPTANFGIAGHAQKHCIRKTKSQRSDSVSYFVHNLMNYFNTTLVVSHQTAAAMRCHWNRTHATGGYSAERPSPPAQPQFSTCQPGAPYHLSDASVCPIPVGGATALGFKSAH